MRILTLSQLSLAGSSGIAEVKVPLWWADGTYVGTNNNGFYLISDGSGNFGTTASPTSANKIFTLSSSWSGVTRFALEADLYINTGANAGQAVLWDITSGVSVGSSLVGTTSTTATVVRSGQFTLTPGHVYGVGIQMSAGTASVYLVDASLIIFP